MTFEVLYFNTDDGIWIHCLKCGWEGQVAGAEFAPNLDDLVYLADEHRKSHD